MIWAAWWAWALAALGLAALEVVVPGWIALGFAIGAGAVALGLATGVLGALVALSGGFGLGVLLLVFAAFSLAGWWGLRAVFGKPGEARHFEDDVNR
jgi:hypothetical protein